MNAFSYKTYIFYIGTKSNIIVFYFNFNLVRYVNIFSISNKHSFSLDSKRRAGTQLSLDLGSAMRALFIFFIFMIEATHTLIANQFLWALAILERIQMYG